MILAASRNTAAKERTAVALRHVPFEDLGLLQPILRQAGWAVAYRDAPRDDLFDPIIERSDLLIVLGGPIGVYEADAYPFLAAELELLKRRLAKGLPTLGICLGSQLIAAALGARVFSGPTKEIGWGRIELTEAGRRSCLRSLGEDGALVLHWHGDTFDLPNGATRLASNTHYDNQAFACGENVLALQFHVEADPDALESWYVGHAVELAAARVSVPLLRRASVAVRAQARTQAHAIFSEWLGKIAAQRPAMA